MSKALSQDLRIRVLAAVVDGANHRKALLRKAAERTVEGLWDAIGRILDAFSPSQCRNCFKAAANMIQVERITL